MLYLYVVRKFVDCWTTYIEKQMTTKEGISKYFVVIL